MANLWSFFSGSSAPPESEPPKEDPPFPHIPDDLLAELDRLYPEVQPPNTQAKPEDLWRAFGQRSVVLLLKFQKLEELERAKDVYRRKEL